MPSASPETTTQPAPLRCVAKARALSSPCGGRVAAADDGDRRLAEQGDPAARVEQEAADRRCRGARRDSAGRRGRRRRALRRRPSATASPPRAGPRIRRESARGRRRSAPARSPGAPRSMRRAPPRASRSGRAARAPRRGRRRASRAGAATPKTRRDRSWVGAGGAAREIAARGAAQGSGSARPGAGRRRSRVYGWVKRSPRATGSLTERISAYDIRLKTRNTNSTPWRSSGSLILVRPFSVGSTTTLPSR